MRRQDVCGGLQKHLTSGRKPFGVFTVYRLFQPGEITMPIIRLFELASLPRFGRQLPPEGGSASTVATGYISGAHSARRGSCQRGAIRN